MYLLDALSIRVLVNKWPNGIDFNLENAALHFSLNKTQGHLEGNPELLCQRKCITEGHKLQFRGFTVPSRTQIQFHCTPTYTHTAERPFYTCHDKPYDLCWTHRSCCHCWNTAVAEQFSLMLSDWRLAIGKYVTASWDFTSHPYTWFSLACMIQLKMFVVYKHRHTWQLPRLKWMKSNRLWLRLTVSISQTCT